LTLTISCRNGSVKQIVLGDTEHYDLWLDPGFKHTDDLNELLRPYEASLMRRYPVSTRVNLVMVA